MVQTVITPCPKCGKRFDFPLTGCITGVAEKLLANSDGNCPDCGTRIVVDEELSERLPHDPFAEAATGDETRGIPIVDLALSVRCRLTLTNMGAQTVGDLLDSGREAVLQRLGESTMCAEDLLALFSANDVDW